MPYSLSQTKNNAARRTHCKRVCRRAAGTAENPVGTGGRPARLATWAARLLPNARAAPVGVELHLRADVR